MGDIVLTAEGLSVGYGKKIVVDGLDIEVCKGEILTIIGPNGAGKSTVLKSIASQLPLISGTVNINGFPVTSMSLNEIARSLSVCFTDRITTEKMTCEDVVSTGRYPYTGKLGVLSENDRKIVRESMTLTGTSSLADIDIRCISDGQRQTIMLARAIAQQPQVLILDEPTSFLDINNKLRLLNILKDLVSIRNNKADRIGTPEEIFSGDYISNLYGITSGTFEPIFGTVEALRIKGKPQVFVIGGGGSGIPVYRSLQRQRIPFAAGIIHENDVEYQVAKCLASELVAEKAFEPISSDSISRAFAVMKDCAKVVCCIKHFGTMNIGNKRLLEMFEEKES